VADGRLVSHRRGRQTAPARSGPRPDGGAAREAASAAAPTAATRRLFIFGDVSSVAILRVEMRGYHYVAVRMPARTSLLALGVLIALLVPHLASHIPCSDRFR